MICDDKPHRTTMNAITTSLRTNIGIKTLRLWLIYLFNEDISFKINLNLREFSSCYFIKEPNALRNVNLLLITQKESLEVLSISHLVDAAILKTILSMSRLKELNLSLGMDIPNYTTFDFLPNHSVTTLSIPTYSKEKAMLKFILALFPNVEFLNISFCNDAIANLISKNCKSLKRLSSSYFCS